ncbi:MAG TPA: RIP metalloprotease RseP [Rhizomicrobium sp.]|jgi:regulator of sigma E protease|nr:RIP metalloprotease RseP [Rhizomicrobium sp.]
MLEALQGFLSWSVYGIPAFLFLITVVVFFHELGHFSVARLFGVRVETFSIGFGRALYSWTDRKGTRWKISWVPLGGFVKFFGDSDGASKPDREAVARMSVADRGVAFPLKPLWQRSLIVAAGPFANFVLAFVILTLFFMIVGRVLTPANVTEVVPHSAAEASGIRAGDVIVSIDGESISSYEEIQQIISVSAGIRLPIVVNRSGHELTLYATPRETEVTDAFKNKMRVGQLGIRNISSRAVVKLGPFTAARAAISDIGNIISITFRARQQLFNGNSSQISGPIGIAKLSGQVASVSFLALIQLAALLSVSIGLVNLFPIPLLDGGHLLYYACEGVLGRPLGERAQDLGFRLGLAVVLGIFILATWNDLARLNLF